MLFFFFGLACTAQSDTAPSSGDSALDDPGSDSVPGVDSDDTALGGRHDSSLDTSPPNDTEPPMDCSGGSGWPPGGSLVDVGGGSAYIWVPKSLPPCAPLVFFGHGGSAAGGYVSGEWLGYEGTDLPALADQLGFVLVVPGVEEGPSTTHSWSLSSDTIDWLTALVEAAWGGVDLDRDRVSFIGTSAGGHMAVYLGLYVVSPWTGIGSLSAGLGGYFDYPSPPPEPRAPALRPGPKRQKVAVRVHASARAHLRMRARVRARVCVCMCVCSRTCVRVRLVRGARACMQV